MSNRKNSQKKQRKPREYSDPFSGMGQTQRRIMAAFRDAPQMTYRQMTAAAFPGLDEYAAMMKVKSSAPRLKRRGFLRNAKHDLWEITEAGREFLKA